MDYLTELISRYRSKGVLIDTNLLLVYFVGVYDPQRIAKFKRTVAFAVEDFYTLLAFFKFFDRVVTTPNILTEVNGFSNQLPDDIKPAYYPEFAKHLAGLEEHYIESRKVSSLAHFNKFGLTDAGIIELVRDQFLVLTNDLRLASYLQNVGVDVVNFNHLRILNWGAKLR